MSGNSIITPKAFVYFVIMQPNKPHMLDFVTLIFTFATPRITFKFLTCDRNHGVFKFEPLRSGVWIVMRPTEMTQPGCTKMAISQLASTKASSNLVGRKSKCYFIIKFSLLLSTVILCWREIRPDTSKTTEK